MGLMIAEYERLSIPLETALALRGPEDLERAVSNGTKKALLVRL